MKTTFLNITTTRKTDLEERFSSKFGMFLLSGFFFFFCMEEFVLIGLDQVSYYVLLAISLLLQTRGIFSLNLHHQQFRALIFLYRIIQAGEF